MRTHHWSRSWSWLHTPEPKHKQQNQQKKISENITTNDQNPKNATRLQERRHYPWGREAAGRRKRGRMDFKRDREWGWFASAMRPMDRRCQYIKGTRGGRALGLGQAAAAAAGWAHARRRGTCGFGKNGGAETWGRVDDKWGLEEERRPGRPMVSRSFPWVGTKPWTVAGFGPTGKWERSPPVVRWRVCASFLGREEEEANDTIGRAGFRRPSDGKRFCGVPAGSHRLCGATTKTGCQHRCNQLFIFCN